jgi:hypothetical protein
VPIDNLEDLTSTVAPLDDTKPYVEDDDEEEEERFSQPDTPTVDVTGHLKQLVEGETFDQSATQSYGYQGGCAQESGDSGVPHEESREETVTLDEGEANSLAINSHVVPPDEY